MENPFDVIFKKKEFLFPYEFPLVGFPYYVDVELTNNCNLDCIMCSRQVMGRPIGYMDMGVFRQIVDEIKNYESAIRFVRWGEPTLHPEFEKAIRYAKDSGVLTYVSTNAATGRYKMLQLYHALPDVIRFSFQGTDGETFERFRYPARCEDVDTSIKIISECRKISGRDIPYLIISSSLTNETEEDKREFEKHWLQYVDRVEFSKTSFFRLENSEEETIERVYKPCPEVLTKLSVDWNGDINACCSDYDANLIMSSLHTSTLKEAWNCEKLETLRSLIGHKLMHYEVPFCKDCYFERSKFDEFKRR